MPAYLLHIAEKHTASHGTTAALYYNTDNKKLEK